MASWNRPRRPDFRPLGALSARRHLRRRALAVVALILAVPGSAQASVLSPDAPHSPNADDISTTYWVLLVVAIVLVVAVHVGLLGAVARFRERRAGPPARVSAGRGVMAWPGALLAALAIVLFIFGIVMTVQVRDLEPSGPGELEATSSRVAQVGVSGAPPSPALESQQPAAEEQQGGPLEINAVGQQWLWRFEYPGHQPLGTPQRFSYGELVVPVDTVVVLNVSSTDVLHRWWVPSLGGQVDAVPGKITRTWFRADQEGTYTGQSTAFSGTAYSTMRPSVRVVSAADYESYIDQLERDLQSAQTNAQSQSGGGASKGEEETP